MLAILLCPMLASFSLVAGSILGPPGGSPEVLARGTGLIFATGLLTAALTVTYVLVAGVARGYLAGSARCS